MAEDLLKITDVNLYIGKSEKKPKTSRWTCETSKQQNVMAA